MGPRKPFQSPYAVIDAVNVRAGTITISHRNSNQHGKETLRVSPITDIQINGQTKKIGDLKKGMRVDVSHGTDVSDASRIVVGS